MNCLVLDPKTVIVEASEVHQQEQMDKLGMNVIPCDLRDAYPLDVYKRQAFLAVLLFVCAPFV